MLKKLVCILSALCIVFAGITVAYADDYTVHQAAAKAIRKIPATATAYNDMTQEEFLSYVRTYLPAGSENVKLSIDNEANFRVSNADEEREGSVFGNILIVCDVYKTHEIVSLKIPKLTFADRAFPDVPTTAYYSEPVRWAVKKNITAGTSATTFSPDDTCTRAQILTFLWRAVGEPKAEGANPFSDVSTNDYYYDAAVWAYQKGMVTADKFEGSTPCTRGETVKFLWINAGSPSSEYKTSFNDVDTNGDYFTAVKWALQNHVTSGTSKTTFSPNDICSRGQIATFLYRAIKK